MNYIFSYLNSQIVSQVVASEVQRGTTWTGPGIFQHNKVKSEFKLKILKNLYSCALKKPEMMRTPCEPQLMKNYGQVFISLEVFRMLFN